MYIEKEIIYAVVFALAYIIFIWSLNDTLNIIYKIRNKKKGEEKWKKMV